MRDGCRQAYDDDDGDDMSCCTHDNDGCGDNSPTVMAMKFDQSSDFYFSRECAFSVSLFMEKIVDIKLEGQFHFRQLLFNHVVDKYLRLNRRPVSD